MPSARLDITLVNSYQITINDGGHEMHCGCDYHTGELVIENSSKSPLNVSGILSRRSNIFNCAGCWWRTWVGCRWSQ